MVKQWWKVYLLRLLYHCVVGILRCVLQSQYLAVEASIEGFSIGQCQDMLPKQIDFRLLYNSR